MDDEKEKVDQDGNDKWIYLLAILFFLTHLNEEALSIWQDFEDEISFRNRYFPNDTHIFEAVGVYAEKAVYNLTPAQPIYRARIIKPAELQRDTKDLLTKISRETDSFKDVDMFKQFEKNRHTNFIKLLDSLHKNKEFLTRIDEESLAKIKQSKFWGYSPEASDAPLKGTAPSGRANPNGISFLYTAEDAHTAVVEKRPIIGQIVSVAEIEIKKEFKLFDFCSISDINIDDDGSKSKAWSILRVISEHFSTPNHQGEHGYFSTQYICEMLKTKFNFDGIRFQSSLNENGINIVLFDKIVSSNETSENYFIKNSSLHIVDGITVSEGKVLPL